MENLATTPEDVLSYVLFPQVAKKFFEDKLNGNLNKNTCDSDEKIHYIVGKMDNCIDKETNNNNIYEIDEEDRIVIALVASAMASQDKPNSEFRISKITRIK